MKQLKTHNRIIKKSLSTFLLLSLGFQQGIFFTNDLYALSSAQSPSTEGVINIEADGVQVSDATSGPAVAGTDNSANNGIVKNFDLVTYNVEVALNDADDTNVLATVTLNDKATWNQLAPECLTVANGYNNIIPDSSIQDTSGDGLNDTMICNLGDKQEGTKILIKPVAQAVGNNTDTIEASVISISDNNINTSGNAGTQGDGPLTTEITAGFGINIDKSIVSLPEEDEIDYISAHKPADSIILGSPEGKVMDWHIALNYNGGSEMVQDDGNGYQTFTITDTWFGTHSSGNAAIEGDNANGDYDDQIVMLGTISGDATDNCSIISGTGSVTCTQNGPGEPITIVTNVPVNQQPLAKVHLKMFIPYSSVFPASGSETYNIDNKVELTSWAGSGSMLTSPTGATDLGPEISTKDYLVSDNSPGSLSFNKLFDGFSWARSGQRAGARGEIIETDLWINDSRTYDTNPAICETLDISSLEFAGHDGIGQKSARNHGQFSTYDVINDRYLSGRHTFSNPTMMGWLSGDTNRVRSFHDAQDYGVTIEYSAIDYTVTGDDHWTATCENDLDGNGSNDWVTDYESLPNGADDVVRVRATWDRDYDQLASINPIQTNWYFVFSFNLKIKDTAPIGSYLPNTAATYDENSATWNGQWMSTINGGGLGSTNSMANVQTDPNNALFSFNTSNADRLLVLPASMAISKVANQKNTLETGDIASFTIDPRTGGSNAAAVTMTFTDTLPSQLQYISDTCETEYQSVGLSCTVSVSGQTITWTVPNYQVGDDLPAFDLLTEVKNGTPTGTYTNSVKISSDFSTFTDDSHCDGVLDPRGDSSEARCKSAFSSAHTSRASILVVSASGYKVEKSIEEQVTEPQADFTNTLTYINLGGTDIGAGHIIDILPHNGDGDENTLRFNGDVLTNTNTSTETNANIAEFVSVAGTKGETFEYTTDPYASIDHRPCHPNNWPTGDMLGGSNTLLNDICSKGLIDPLTDIPTPTQSGTAGTTWGALPSDLSSITAFRATTQAFAAGQPARVLTLTMNTGESLEDDLFCNNFGSNANGIALDIISNDVCIPVVAGSIGDRVWYDADGDGVQDGDTVLEPGIANVTLALLDAAGVPIYVDPATGGIVDSSFAGAVAYTTTTDTDGNYLFENLPSGDYQVQVVANTLPDGMIQSYDSNGTGTLNTSTHSLLQEFDSFGNLIDIEDNVDQDFGYTALIDLEVNKLVDVDGDDTYTNFEIMDVPGINGNPDPTTFNYQITLENTSPYVAGTNVTLTDIIPPGVTVMASTMSPTNIAPSESLPLTGAALTGTPITWTFPTVGTETTTTIILDAELTAANVSDFQVGFDSGKSTQNVVQITAMDETDIDSVPNNGTAADFGGSTSGFNSGTSEDDEDDARIGIPPAIGNYVWLDSNNDGIQDPEEIGIEGVTVNLYDATDTIIATTTTNADGGYFFTDLTDGVPYYVGFDHNSAPLTNFNPSEQDNTATTDALDSDGDITTGFTDPYTLSPGEVYSDFDQGYVPIMSIGNRVFEDTNADGSMGAGELGIANVTVELRDANGDPFSTPVTTTTDADGYYLFTDLTPDDYTVFIPQQTAIENHLTSPGNPDPNNGVDNDDNGGEVTSGTPADGYITDVVTLTPNQEGEGETGGSGSQTDNANDANSNLTVDFGFFPPALPTIEKSFDIETIAPNGISTLTLTLGNTNAFDITLSDDFTDTLPSGLEIAPTPNIQNTCPDTPTANSGSAAVTYPNGSILPVGGCSIMVDVTGDTDGDYTNLIGTGALMTNIGNSPESTTDDITIISSSIGDTIWFDLNRDGFQDQTELDNPPAIIDGLTVNLLDENGNIIATTTTDENGYYLFDGLTPGDYSVAVVLPNNLFLSDPQSDASNDDVAADSNFGSTATSSTSTMNTFTTSSITLGLGEDKTDIDGGVYSSMPTVEKEFSVETIAPGSTSRLTLILGNINVFALTLTADLTDTLPTGIVVADTPNIETTCPATPVAESGSDTVVYPNGSLLPVGGCTIMIDVTGDTDGTYTNTIPVGALQTNIGNSPMATTDDIIIKSSSIGDTIWFDTNRDGIQDQSELDTPPVSVENLTVNLLDENGIVISTTTTTSTGYYLFDDLLPDNYSVSLELPSTLYLSDSSRGEDENVDSNFPTTATSVDSTDGTKTFQTSSITLGLAQDKIDIDGGVYFIAGTTVSSSSSSSSSSSGGGGGGGGSSSSSSSSSGGFTTTTTNTATTNTPTETTETETETSQEPTTETVTPTLPSVQEVEGPVQQVPTTYIPFPNQFAFPILLPQTGTPLLERVSIIQNPKLNLDPPSWAQPDLEQVKTDISYWKNEVLPYPEDRSAEEYVVIPTLGVIAPISYVPQNSQDYEDIVKDGTQIRDFSLRGGTNYLEYLDQGVMQYPGTLPIALPAGENKEYTGNTVVFGHSSYWKSNEGKYDTVFGLLPTLDVGEEVWVFTRKNSDDGEYELRRHMIEKSYNTSASDVQILTQQGFDTPHLTLFTCTPIGGIEGRWIVQSKLIEDQVSPAQTAEQQAILEEKQKIQAAEDLKYGSELSRVLRLKSKTMFGDLYERAGESNRERLTDFLLERLEMMSEKYETDEKTMMYLEFLEEELMKMK